MDLSILNRRSFLKASAMTGVAVALSEVSSGLVQTASAQAAPTTAPEETKIVKTICKACIHNCPVLAHVRNGRIVKLEGNPEGPMNRGSICAKGLSGISALYHPNRNKYPLIRVGERGENKWKRISWNEAIDTVAKKVCDVTNKYGAERIVVSTGGGGNPHFFSVVRAANAIGTPNFFEPGCAQCYLPRTLAYHLQYGDICATPSIADLACLEIYKDDAPIKQMVFWGTDPSYSNPAAGGGAVAEKRSRGVKTVSIDPRFVPDAAKADVWLPIRAGTDVALELAWIKYIIDNDLYDHDFVMKWTNCPYLVDTDTKFIVKAKDFFGKGGDFDRVVWDKKTNAPALLSYPWDDNLDPELDGEFQYNGKTYKTGFRLLRERCEPWTLEAAGKECWLDPVQIEKAIKIYCSGPGGISLGVATDQSPNSVEAAMGSVILNALRGNIECPGALMQRFPMSVNAAAGGCILGPSPQLLPKGQLKKRLGGNEHKGLYQWSASSPPIVLEAMRTGKPYQPLVWLERSGNKFGVVADATAWEEGAKNMELIVHMFMYPTSFSQFADILLPAAEWLETNIPIENLNLIFARQAVAHTWETVDETLWWSKLIKRCAALGHENAKRACDPQFMGKDTAYWDTMEELLDAKLADFGLTWKELLEKQPVAFMPYDKWNSYYVYKQIDPETGKPKGFNTPTKKIEVYGDVYIELARTGKPYAMDEVPPASIDYDPLPFYTTPSENPYNEVGKEYPLVMTNGRLPMYHHGTLRNIPYLREIYPAPEIWVNPVDCKKYGVKNGDWVWVESKRGKVRAICRETLGVQPGQVYQERFWFPEKILDKETHGYKECNVNVLSKRTGPYNGPVGTYTLRGYQVRISKAPGAPEGIWLKPEDFKPWLPQPTDNTPNPEL